MKTFSTLNPVIFNSYYKRVLTTCSFLFLLVPVIAQSPLISLQNGKLVYNKYANQRQQNAVNQIPDFSNAGYRGGGVKIPDRVKLETEQLIRTYLPGTPITPTPPKRRPRAKAPL